MVTQIYIIVIIESIVLSSLLLSCLILRFKKSRAMKQRRFNIIKFSKSIVITIFLLLISYVVTVLIIFIVTGNEPVILTENLFGFFKAEGGFLAIIKVAGEVTERVLAAKRKCSEPTSDNREEINDYD